MAMELGFGEVFASTKRGERFHGLKPVESQRKKNLPEIFPDDSLINVTEA